MGNLLKQFRSRELSLWQSAADKVAARQQSATGAVSNARPDLTHPLVRGAAAVGKAVEEGDFPTVSTATGSHTLDIADRVRYCAEIAFKLARARVTGNEADVKRYREELTGKFGDCDPMWAEKVTEYVKSFRLLAGSIPYRGPQWPGYPFVIDGRLPSDAKIGLVADWGTGQPEARKLLQKLKDKDPDVVIHLGDIYYSGTEHEVRDYFYAIWQDVLGVPAVPWGEKLADLAAQPATFTLSGNHDMYSGGQPYYALIDMLGQPASYFCLRNDLWQFVALDTGFNDHNPTADTATFLQETEVGWLKDRIAQSSGRKTVLLSHHQLFSAYEEIAGQRLNRTLFAQVRDVLPQVTAWFWGHEHNLVVYKRFEEGGNILSRCIGHGAFPVDVDEPAQGTPAVPVEDVKLAVDRRGGLFQHGYVMLELRGSRAEVTYYQYDAESDQETPLYSEIL